MFHVNQSFMVWFCVNTGMVVSEKPEAAAPMPPASYSSPPTLLSFGDTQYKMTASKTKIPEQCSGVPSLQQQLPSAQFGQYSVAQTEPSTMSATGESMNVTREQQIISTCNCSS